MVGAKQRLGQVIWGQGEAQWGVKNAGSKRVDRIWDIYRGTCSLDPSWYCTDAELKFHYRKGCHFAERLQGLSFVRTDLGILCGYET